MKRCYKCGAALNDDDNFCVFCGANLNDEPKETKNIHFCPTCNLEINEDEKFCTNCGALNPYYKVERKDYIIENTEYKEETPKEESRKDLFKNNILKTIPEFYKNYFKIKGKACRSEYWVPVLIVSVITAIIGSILTSSLPQFNYVWKLYGTEMLSFNLISIIIEGILLTIPQITCAIRRIRDTGRSGMSVLLYFIPLVGPIIIFVFLVSDTNSKRK